VRQCVHHLMAATCSDWTGRSNRCRPPVQSITTRCKLMLGRVYALFVAKRIFGRSDEAQLKQAPSCRCKDEQGSGCCQAPLISVRTSMKPRALGGFGGAFDRSSKRHAPGAKRTPGRPPTRILNVPATAAFGQPATTMWCCTRGSCTTGSTAVQRGNKPFRTAL
jgi:hypothetical protein